ERVVAQQIRVGSAGRAGAAKQVRVEHEEVDGINPSGVEAAACAWAETVSDHSAEISRVLGDAGSERSSLAGVQVTAESRMREAVRRSQATERGFEDWCRGLARQTIVGETRASAIGLVDGEVLLRGFELSQEAVLEDIHLVHVVGVPQTDTMISRVPDFENG